MIQVFIKSLLVRLIMGLRPLLGPASCYFEETCCPFSLRMLKEKPLLIACIAIAKRIFLCNPISAYYAQKKLFIVLFIGITVLNANIYPATNALYTARRCNAISIRELSVIQAFLQKTVAIIDVDASATTLENYGKNGFIVTQLLADAGIISVLIDNEANTLHLNLFLGRELSTGKQKNIPLLIKEYFGTSAIERFVNTKI